ncbi:histidine kinase [candidate division KSB1 bacterium]|nr:MAG: histidine kinase [candidate division KSB1 bacterium]
MTKVVFSTFQAAEYCNTSYMSIKRWIFSGKLKAYKTPGGHYRILKDDLLDFMAKNNIPVYENVLLRKRVLIVDDDCLVRESIANFLRSNCFGFEVATAEDGFEAGVLVSQFLPNIIILDLMMPKMDGFKVCRKIKKNPLTKKIKLLVLTGFADEENVNKAYEYGADMVLSKPLEMDELLDAINSII